MGARRRARVVLWVVAISIAARTASAVVINEALHDPGASGDANGDGVVHSVEDEFVELVNETAFAVDVSGWTLSDATAVRHVIPSGTTIPAGCALIVFGGGAPTGPFGGALVQTASTGGLSLNNSTDAITIAQGGTSIDAQTYVTTVTGVSLNRDPDVTGPGLVRSDLIVGSSPPWRTPGTRLTGEPFPGCATSTPVPALPRSTSWLLGGALLLAFAVVTALVEHRRRTAS